MLEITYRKILFTRSEYECRDRVMCSFPVFRRNRLLRARLSGHFSQHVVSLVVGRHIIHKLFVPHG